MANDNTTTKGTARRSSRVTEATNMIEKVKKNFSTKSYYTAFLYFQIGIGEGRLVLRTDSVGFLKDSSTNMSTNLLMSLELVKNGSGLANSFTVEIGYAPELLGVSISKGQLLNYINKIDDALVKSKRNCKLQYGYIMSDGTTLFTSKYSGMITDYNVSIENQIIKYTIKGYSSAVMLSERLYSFPALSIQNVTGEDGTTTDETERVEGTATRDTEDVTVMSFADLEGNTDGLDPIDIAKFVLKRTVGEDNENFSKNGKAYKIVVEDDVKVNKLKEIKAASNVSVFEYVNTLLNLATEYEDSNETDNTGTSGESTTTENNSNTVTTSTTANQIKRTIFDMEISDSGERTITIYKYNPIEKISNTDIVFDIIDSGNTIVKSFNTEFKGSVLMALASAQNSSKDDSNTTVIDPEGEDIGSDVEFINITPTEELETDAKIESSSWATEAHHSYKAEMTTMGIPVEIPIMYKMKILPVIYNAVHHTHGIYAVTGVTDSISSSGFETTFKLIKLAASDIEDYIESVKNDDSSTLKDGEDASTGIFTITPEQQARLASGESTILDITMEQRQAAAAAVLRGEISASSVGMTIEQAQSIYNGSSKKGATV